jgi:hypothetical protein
MRRLLTIFVLLFALASAAAAEDLLSSWYAGSASARMYVSVRGELSSVLAEAERRNIPPQLLMARIAEGAEKRVAPAKLVEALRKDCDYYAIVLSEVLRAAPGAQATAGWQDLLSRGAMALRSGMDAESFENVLRVSAGRAIGPRRAIDALVAVAAVDSRLPIGAEGKQALALSLASSSEREAVFSMLSSLFLRGRAGKMAARDLVALSVSVLDSGGGFLQLESEIARRLK